MAALPRCCSKRLPNVPTSSRRRADNEAVKDPPLRSGATTTNVDSFPVGTAMLLASLTFAVLRQGAYHQWQHQVFAWLVLGSAVLLVLVRSCRPALATAAVIVAPLFLSTAVSSVLSDDRTDARSTFLQILLVGVGLAAGAAIPEQRRITLLHGFLMIAMIVAATAVYGVAAHSAPWGRITAGVWRGSSSLTYSNAAAAVLGPGALLTFGLAARSTSRGYPVVAAALAVALISTQSRAGIAATALVGLWLIRRQGARGFAETALPILAGVIIGIPLLLVYASDAKDPQPAIVLVTIIVGLGVTAVAWPWRTRIRHPVMAVGGLAFSGLVLATITGMASSLGQRLTLRSGTTAQGEDASVLFGDRGREWSTAWDQFMERPVVGHGPGVVNLTWTEDGRSFRALFVHNEYLEYAVTNGAVGLAALALSAMLFLRFRSANTPDVAVLFVIAGYLLHSGFDYLWHLPALPVLFAVVAGTQLRRGVKR